MGLYRNISTNFWVDSKVDDDFTAKDKYMYLYLLTNPHTNICGCYEIGNNQMQQEAGLPWDEIESLLYRLQDVHNVIRYAPDTKEILILNWGRYNWSRSEKVQAAVLAVASHIKNPGFLEYVRNAIDSKMQEMTSADKKERSKEKTVSSKQITVTSNQIPESRKQKSDKESVTDVSIGYGYPMDTLSEPVPAEGGSDSDFERFWNAYPRKVNRDDAIEAFAEVDVSIEVILSAIDAQKKSQEWSNKSFIPHPANWLRKHRWTDKSTPLDATTTARKSASGVACGQSAGEGELDEFEWRAIASLQERMNQSQTK